MSNANSPGQRPLNSTYAPKIGRDGAPKNTQADIPPAHGMRNRTAEHTLMPGFSNPLDDEKLEKKLTPVTPHPSSYSTMTPEHRGQHVPGMDRAVLENAANLGRPTSEGKVINRRDNGRASGGSRPVTSRD